MATETLLSVSTLDDPENPLDSKPVNCPKEHARTGLKGLIFTSYEESEDLMTFISHVFTVYDGTVVGHFTCAATSIIALFAVILGLTRYHSCPCEPCVPMFLVVGGCTLVLKASFQAFRCCCRKKKRLEDTEPDLLQTFQNILTIMAFFWTIPGVVWIFGIINQVNTEHSYMTTYCDFVLYWFTVGYIATSVFAMLVMVAVIVGLCVIHNRCDGSLRYEGFDDDDEERVEFDEKEEDHDDPRASSDRILY